MLYCPNLFGTLSTSLKADIIALLKDGDLTVNDLAQKAGEERSKVSHALRTLKRCGFVYAERQGRNQVYSINKETILPLLKLAEQHMRQHCKKCKVKRNGK